MTNGRQLRLYHSLGRRVEDFIPSGDVTGMYSCGPMVQVYPQMEVAEAAPTSTEEVTLPGPDETVSFAAHVKALFREYDRQSMSFAFDL